MAKTRKSAGSRASRARRTTTRGSSRSRRGGGARRRGRQLDLKPFKRQIKKHIDTFSRIEKPDAKTRAALASLKRVQRDLTKACLPTMVIGFP